MSRAPQVRRFISAQSTRAFGALVVGFLSLACVSRTLAGTYYTHYTNAGCQVALTLSTNQVLVGEALGLSVVAYDYRSGYTTSGPYTTIPVEVLLDGEKTSTLSAPWHPYGTTPIASSITNLTVDGPHTVTIQHTNDFEYYNETVYSHSVYHNNPFGADWYDYYYNVYHYRTVPCSASQTFAVIVISGTVVGWGYNGHDQINTPAGLTNVTAIAAGSNHSLALKVDGLVVGWGANNYGQINIPVGLTNVIAIAAGEHHGLALKNDGTVIGWGYNVQGQTNVPAGLTNVTAIAAGANHSLALKGDGTVVGWGYNYYGQISIPAGLTNVSAIAAGQYHSLALKGDGTVVGWGYNYFGQISIPAGLTNVTALAAGFYYSLALQDDGTVVGWGDNSLGQISIPAGLANVIAISAGVAHNLSLEDDGTVVGWGHNGNGQINIPVGLTNATGIAAGYYHSLALVPVELPSISSQPESATVDTTSNVTFSVTATGTGPLAYQWQKDGVAIDGAITAVLMLSNVQTNQAGDYTVIVSNVADSLTSSVAVLTVNRRAQTISFDALPDKQEGATSFALSATAGSGLPVSYTSSDPTVATVSGNTVTITGIGITTITAAQAGDATYLPADNVNQPLTVTSAKYLLAVNNGTGGGSYTNGQIVAITASNAPPGELFDIWLGATQFVASVRSATTTITMPTQDISVTATYSATLSDAKAITSFTFTTANSGTLVNDPLWTSGRYGNGLALSNGDYVTVPAPAPDILNITGDLTIALWVNPNSVTCSGSDPAYALVSKRSVNHATPFELLLGNGGTVKLQYWGTDIQWPTFAATGTVTTGAWQHIVATRSFSGASATVTFYIDGVEAGRSTAATGPVLGSSDPVWIARDGYHTGYTTQGSYSGLMDEVQLYNRALSAPEISRIYTNDSLFVPGRVGNWGFDETSGMTAFDRVAEGTIDEGARTVSAAIPVGTDVTALVPRITVSPLATVAPLSGVAQDFSSQVIYTVSAEDSSTQNHTVTVAYKADGDDNGLPDEWELDYFGGTGVDPSAICSNDLNTLTDAYIAGFSPTDPLAGFSINGFDGTLIEWGAVSGRVYSVYWSTNLLAGFQAFGTNYTGGSFLDTLHSAESRCFYKVDVRMKE